MSQAKNSAALTTGSRGLVKGEDDVMGGMEALAATVAPVRHQVANPAPLGLYAFGFTTALLQGAVTQITEPQPTENLTFCFALAYGGTAQLLAGMWEMLRANTFAATAFSSYGAFWLGLGTYGILAQAGIWNGESVSKAHSYGDLHGTQMMLIIWGILTFLFFVQTLRINRALQLLFICLSALFFMLAGGKVNPLLNKVAGYFGIWVGAVAFYIATAELLTETWGKASWGSDYLPLGRYQKAGGLMGRRRRRSGAVEHGSTGSAADSEPTQV